MGITPEYMWIVQIVTVSVGIIALLGGVSAVVNNAVGKRLDNVEAAIIRMESKIDNLSNKVVDMKDDFGEKLNNVNSKLDRFDSRVEMKVTHLESSLDAMQAAQTLREKLVEEQFKGKVREVLKEFNLVP